MLPRSNIHHVGGGGVGFRTCWVFTQRSLHHKNLAHLGNAKAQAEQLPSRLRRDSVQARLSDGPEALKMCDFKARLSDGPEALKMCDFNTQEPEDNFFRRQTVLVCESTSQQT